MLQKLKATRFSEQCVQWFRSYICGKIFLVETENKLSDFGKISCGVPQGSILGPLLFLVYGNNMPQAVKSNLLLYQHKYIAKIEKILNKDVENICALFVDSKWSIHFGDGKINQFSLQVSKGMQIFIN